MPSNPFRSITALGLLTYSCSGVLYAAEVSIDHAATTADPASSLRKTVSVTDSEEIKVNIANTCPEHFEYLITASAQLERPKVPESGAVRSTGLTCSASKPFSTHAKADLCILKSTKLTTRHNAGFDYDLRVEPKSSASFRGISQADFNLLQTAYNSAVNAPGFTCDEPNVASKYAEVIRGNAGKLKRLAGFNLTLITPNKDRGWYYSLAGGFSVSWLTDQEFEITGPDDMRLFDRSRSSEDDQSLGLVAYVHVQNDDICKDSPKCNRFFRHWTPLSFGVGTDSSELDFYLGTSFRFRDVAYLTAGYNWGQRDGRPQGQLLGATPINDNVLSNLNSRTDGNFFLSVSYKFLDFGGAGFLNKLFKPMQQPEESVSN